MLGRRLLAPARRWSKDRQLQEKQPRVTGSLSACHPPLSLRNHFTWRESPPCPSRHLQGLPQWARLVRVCFSFVHVCHEKLSCCFSDRIKKNDPTPVSVTGKGKITTRQGETARNQAAHVAKASAPPAKNWSCQTTSNHCTTVPSGHGEPHIALPSPRHLLERSTLTSRSSDPLQKFPHCLQDPLRPFFLRSRSFSPKYLHDAQTVLFPSFPSSVIDRKEVVGVVVVVVVVSADGSQESMCMSTKAYNALSPETN